MPPFTTIPVGIVMLTPVFLSLFQATGGRSSAELVADITGLSPQILRRRLALPRHARRRADVQHKVVNALAEALGAAGHDPAEARRLADRGPEGLLEGTVYHLGLFEDVLHPTALSTLRRHDEVDREVDRFLDARDAEGLWAWLDAMIPADDRLRQPLFASGTPALPRDGTDFSIENLSRRLANMMGHQLLSLLAIIDLEIKPKVASPAWDGHSLLAPMIAPAAEPAARQRLLTPLALLLDLVAGSAMNATNGRWPSHRPTPSVVAKWMSSRGQGGADFESRMHRLRSGHAKLTANAFMAFVREVRTRQSASIQQLDDEARMLCPLLVGAHLISLMMPRIPGTSHHDRQGWRESYLDWWTYHAMARGLPTEPASPPGLPAWIRFDQSS